MNQLIKRLIWSAILITITCSAIFLAPYWVFFLIVESFLILALREFLNLAEKKGVVVNRPLTFFWAVLLSFSFHLDLAPIILLLACLSAFVLDRKSTRLNSSH